MTNDTIVRRAFEVLPGTSWRDRMCVDSAITPDGWVIMLFEDGSDLCPPYEPEPLELISHRPDCTPGQRELLHSRSRVGMDGASPDLVKHWQSRLVLYPPEGAGFQECLL